MAFTSAYGAPQLVEYVGAGPPKPMQDEPNDMHAVGAVLFQLLASTDAAWQRQYGEWMFGPMNSDLEQYIKLKKDGEQKSFTRAVLLREHKEWVRQTPAHSSAMNMAAPPLHLTALLSVVTLCCNHSPFWLHVWTRTCHTNCIQLAEDFRMLLLLLKSG